MGLPRDELLPLLHDLGGVKGGVKGEFLTNIPDIFPEEIPAYWQANIELSKKSSREEHTEVRRQIIETLARHSATETARLVLLYLRGFTQEIRSS